MTPFQRLLADEEALARYVVECRKLPEHTWSVGDHFAYIEDIKFDPPRLLHGVVTYIDTDMNRLDYFCIDYDDHIGHTEVKNSLVYLPADLAEWMAMDGWENWWTLCYRGNDHLGWAVTDSEDDCATDDISQSAHPHLAAAEAVVGGD